VSEPSPESVGEVGAVTALAIVIGGLILLLVVIGLFVFLTLNNPAVL
jgi:hypothetical protein